MGPHVAVYILSQFSGNRAASQSGSLVNIYCNKLWTSLSQYFYPGGTLEIIFRSQGTPA
jgi:hypothetical protein